MLVTPYIKTRSGQAVTMPIGEKLESLGFKRVYPFLKEMFAQSAGELERVTNSGSLVEMDERHMIGREIHIVEK